MTSRLPVEFTRFFKGNRQRCGNRVQLENQAGLPISHTNPLHVIGGGVNDTFSITLGDTAAIDAFARLRVSNPFTIFDSKQVTDELLDFYWDDQEVSGGGTSSAYDADFAVTILSVSNAVAGKRVRQTMQRFNYQPGKSQMAFITFVMNNSAANITKRVGLFDDDNGIFFENDGGNLSLNIRSSTSGAPVDTSVAQANWNLDKFNGAGESGVTLDPTKAQILFIDLEWLGVGRVRTGFVIDGIPIYAHEFLHANSIASVYMTTPNLPVRYSIENDGAGGASSLDCICSSIVSEGGFEPYGVTRTAGTGRLYIDANTSGTFYALVGIRLKATCLGGLVLLENIDVFVNTNDAFYWELRFNPAVGGVFTYNNLTDSIVQAAVGDTSNNPSTNTVTGGHVLFAGYGSNISREVSAPVRNSLRLGALIDDTPNTIVLCVTPAETHSNLDIAGLINWREVF